MLVSRINIWSERAVALKLHVLLLFALNLRLLKFSGPDLRILKELLVMRAVVAGAER